MREAQARLLHEVEAAASRWLDAVATNSGGFTSARNRRAHAIAARQAGDQRQAFQAGLFDRRAQRARDADVNDAAERRRHTRARVTAAAQAAPLTARPVELLLVLTP